MSDDLLMRLDALVEELGEGRACCAHDYIDAAVDAMDYIDAMEVKLRKAALSELSALGQASEAYTAQLEAEAKIKDAADTIEKALKDKAISDEWAWIFEDTLKLLKEGKNDE